MNKVNILIVDDHPIIIEGYKNALLDMKPNNYDLDISTADSCTSAYKKLKSSTTSNPYDIIFLDLNLPPCSRENISSGIELGKIAKRLLPEIKIIVLTTNTNYFNMHHILKNLSPDGFLIKSDINSDELIQAFNIIMNQAPYYSNSVSKFIKIQLTNDLNLDDIDRKILHLLATGVRTKSLPTFIPLSLAAIEKRKRNLKNLFGVEKTNSSLLEVAAKKGYI